MSDDIDPWSIVPGVYYIIKAKADYVKGEDLYITSTPNTAYGLSALPKQTGDALNNQKWNITGNTLYTIQLYNESNADDSTFTGIVADGIAVRIRFGTGPTSSWSIVKVPNVSATPWDGVTNYTVEYGSGPGEYKNLLELVEVDYNERVFVVQQYPYNDSNLPIWIFQPVD